MNKHCSNGRQRRAPRFSKLQANRFSNFALYESLKAEFTAAATTSAEYEAACRKAAKLAGV